MSTCIGWLVRGSVIVRVPVTLTPAHDVPLEVVTRKSGLVTDPVPLRGSAVSLADVEAALGYAVATATAPWAEQHMAAPPPSTTA